MLNKLISGLESGAITTVDLESAERLFRFLADAIKETRVELAMSNFDSRLEGFVRAKQIIPAIKLYRELHPGTGLKEAKDEVEKLGDLMGVRKNNSWNFNPA